MDRLIKILKESSAERLLKRMDELWIREDAEMYLKKFEEDDKADGNYSENFYEIVDTGKDFVVTGVKAPQLWRKER